MSAILVVDDKPLNRQYLVTLLGYFGHDVSEGANGIEALESLRGSAIDLVIADLLMPTMDGYEFLRRLRRERNSQGPPVIFYSAATFELQARLEAQALGVRHFLTKPTEPPAMVAAVNSALGLEGSEISPTLLKKFYGHVCSIPADVIDHNAVVYVVDDDFEIRHSLSALIREVGFNVETFSGGQEFLESYDAKRFGCLVVETVLPNLGGLDLAELLRARRDFIPVIILTGHGTTASAARALRLGAVDYFEKPFNRQTLLSGILRALQHASIEHRQASKYGVMQALMATLTPREKDLLQLMVLGMSNKEIAVRLKISVKTVSHHRAHLMAKTGASNAADLVRMSLIVAGK